MSERRDNQDVGSEAATIERVRNSSLVKCSGADNGAGLKRTTETVGLELSAISYQVSACLWSESSPALLQGVG